MCSRSGLLGAACCVTGADEAEATIRPCEQTRPRRVLPARVPANTPRSETRALSQNEAPHLSKCTPPFNRANPSRTPAPRCLGLSFLHHLAHGCISPPARPTAPCPATGPQPFSASPAPRCRPAARSPPRRSPLQTLGPPRSRLRPECPTRFSPASPNRRFAPAKWSY